MSEFIRYDLPSIQEAPLTSGELHPVYMQPHLTQKELFLNIPVVTVPVDNFALPKYTQEEEFQKTQAIGDGYWEVIHIDYQKSQYFNQCSGPVRGRILETNTESRGSGHAIGRRIVLTAGHVIHPDNGGQVYEPIRFIPGHPWRTVVHKVKRVYVAQRWASSADVKSDIAILLLDDELDIDGYSGLVTGMPGNEKLNQMMFFTTAYPSKPPFGNQTEQIHDWGPASNWAFMEDSGLYFRSNMEAWEKCDLTEGASGGAWLLGPNRFENIPKRRLIQGKYWGKNPNSNLKPWDVNGINSFTVEGKPGCIYSPEFNDIYIAPFVIETMQDIASS